MGDNRRPEFFPEPGNDQHTRFPHPANRSSQGIRVLPQGLCFFKINAVFDFIACTFSWVIYKFHMFLIWKKCVFVKILLDILMEERAR